MMKFNAEHYGTGYILTVRGKRHYLSKQEFDLLSGKIQSLVIAEIISERLDQLEPISYSVKRTADGLKDAQCDGPYKQDITPTTTATEGPF